MFVVRKPFIACLGESVNNILPTQAVTKTASTVPTTHPPI